MMRRLYVMPVPKGNLTHVSHMLSIYLYTETSTLLSMDCYMGVQSVGGFEDEDDMEDEDDEEQVRLSLDYLYLCN